MKDFIQLAADRFSVRGFADREVEAEKIERIVEAALRSPTACNLQPYRIWIARSGDAREKVLGCVLLYFLKTNHSVAIIRRNLPNNNHIL